MRLGQLRDAVADAAGAVHLPLSRMPPADQLSVRHVRDLPALPDPPVGAVELLHVSDFHRTCAVEKRESCRLTHLLPPLGGQRLLDIRCTGMSSSRSRIHGRNH